MTLYLVFEDLKAGRIKLDTALRVSKRAASMAPSKLGMKPGSTITVDQAIKALVTKSANDVAATVAENLGGSESAFAARMTTRAKALGMSRTVFRNASGLPNPQQVTTARDMATLSLRIQRDFPEQYKYFSIQAFNYKGRTIKTHNRLLGRYSGTDGIKTGYIRASGFNLTTSAKRGSKRVVGVVLGAQSGGARNRYMMAMLDQAFPKCQNGTAIVASVGGAAASSVAEEPAVKKQVSKGKSASGTLSGGETTEAASPPEEQDEEAAENAVTIDDEDKSALNDLLGDQPDIASGSPPPGEIPFEVKPFATPSAISDGWHIQIGAYPTKNAAQSKIEQARKTASRQLEGKAAFTMEFQKGNETVYRARFSGFSEDSAKDACKRLEKKGIGCLALAPQG
jgi:D-alanyl-D-alanine carboxypeptidase